MKNFLSRFESLITGVLSGFDRLVFRGNLIPFHLPHGMFRPPAAAPAAGRTMGDMAICCELMDPEVVPNQVTKVYHWLPQQSRRASP